MNSCIWDRRFVRLTSENIVTLFYPFHIPWYRESIEAFVVL